MRIRDVSLIAIGLVLLVLVAAEAADPPPDPGYAVLCMYTYFDEESGPADGEVFYPEYSLLTPLDIYTVLYHPRGADQSLLAVEYGVHYRQEDWYLEYGEDYGYLVDEWFPGAGGVVDLYFIDDHMAVVVYPPCPHDGVAVVVRHSQFFLLQAPLPGASIEVTFVPNAAYHNEMHYVDGADDELVFDMWPNSDGYDHENPVFVFQGDVVAVQPRSLSAVKQLFR